jgi:hypothetical protein
VQNEHSHTDATAQPSQAAEPITPTTWQAELSAILARASAISADHGVELDDFMRGAWTAYVEARPGFREHLADVELRQQLAELRKQGKIEIA